MIESLLKRTKKGLSKEKSKKENIQRKELKNILKVADNIIQDTSEYDETHPIYLLIKQLVSQELNKNIYNSISTFESDNVKSFTEHNLLPYSKNKYLYMNLHNKKVTYFNFLDEAKVEGIKVKIRLGCDPVLTRPWNVGRLINAYSNIGKGKKYGDWIEDNNHKARLILPFGITFVEGGNHSITTGILNNEGELNITYIYDFSKIFSYIYCDGVNYFRKKDNSFYATVNNFPLATVFEIGRLIHSYRINKQIQFKNITTIK